MGWTKHKRKDDASSTKLDGTRLERYPEWARMVKRTARAQQAAMIWEHFVGYASDETEAEKMVEPKVPESTETAKAMADRLWAASHTPTNPGGLASKITTPEAKAAWSSVDTQAKLHGDREHIAEGILKDALDGDLLVQVKTALQRGESVYRCWQRICAKFKNRVSYMLDEAVQDFTLGRLKGRQNEGMGADERPQDYIAVLNSEVATMNDMATHAGRVDEIKQAT